MAFLASSGAGVLCVALMFVYPRRAQDETMRLGQGLVRRPVVELLDEGDAEWNVNQAFGTFEGQQDEEHPAVQQAWEFVGNETARRKERVCEFIGDMADTMGEMSSERALEMMRSMNEVSGDAEWEDLKNKFVTSKKWPIVLVGMSRLQGRVHKDGC